MGGFAAVALRKVDAPWATAKALSWRIVALCCFACRPQDSQDPNPLIRALAVRTMGCIRVDKITEYLCDPLHRCLKVGWRSWLNDGSRSQRPSSTAAGLQEIGMIIFKV